MTVGGLLVVLVMIGALAVTVGRWALANALPAMVLTFVAVFCGAAGGLSTGGVVGMMLGIFLGLAPATAQNETFMALCLGFIGAVVGGLSALMYIQRRPANTP